MLKVDSGYRALESDAVAVGEEGEEHPPDPVLHLHPLRESLFIFLGYFRQRSARDCDFVKAGYGSSPPPPPKPPGGFRAYSLQAYLAHKKQHPPLGSPYGPRQRPTLGSLEGAVSYERGTPVGFGPADAPVLRFTSPGCIVRMVLIEHISSNC